MRYLVALLVCFGLAQALYAQSDEQLGLHSEGGPWKFYPAVEQNDSLKKVLLIGDSVMNGFHKSVIDSLKKIANVDYWLTPKHLNSEHLFTDLAKVVSSQEYDVIQFNIGLHGWPEGRDVEFKLTAPQNTTIKGQVKDGEILNLEVSPVSREKDILMNYNYKNS